jgi:polysaccharide biosynthesis protein PslG
MGRMTVKKMTSRRVIALGIVALVLAAGLALDLANRGFVWGWLWSITGEEAPLAQVRGAVEWLGNFTRPQPRTDPLVPINHVSDSPYGINTFLEQEVEIAKRDQQVQMIAAAGFGWIRQEFPWQDIEIHARGDFTDRRNDPNGVDAWAKYDHIVDVVEQYGLRLQVRLSNPPSWTHADPAIGEKAPPDDLQDFVNYAVAVAERYRGRITHYQIWNEPNIYPEWGEQAVSPEAYTEMLCRTYDALKAVDPNIVVISAALAPTINLAERNLSDLIFLQRMYDAGAARCFDIMSTQGYGFFSGPTDQRLRPTTLTFNHHLYLRDIMVANGDAHKPIWLAEAAWNAQPEDPALVTSQYGNFGIVTEGEAARYMPLAYEEAQRRYPWLGVINYWFFKRADDSERNQAFYYFRMVEPDFTPLPVYDAMREYISSTTPALYTGMHQAESYRILRPDDAQTLLMDAAQLGSGVRASRLFFNACGTDVTVRWRGEALRVLVTGQILIDAIYLANENSADGWTQTTIVASPFALCLPYVFDSPTDDQLVEFDSVLVRDRSSTQLALLIIGALIVAATFGYAALTGWQARRR